MNPLSTRCTVRGSVPIMWKVFSFPQYPSRPDLLPTSTYMLVPSLYPKGKTAGTWRWASTQSKHLD